MFDPRSRELASYLGEQIKKDSSAEKPVVKQTPVAPIEKVDLEGELKLENYYPWTNKSKQSVRGRFIKLSGENLLIELMNGRREATIALDSIDGVTVFGKKIKWDLRFGTKEEVGGLPESGNQ